MTTTNPYQAVVWEGGCPVLLARITGYDNANITQATLSAAAYRVDSLAQGVATEVVATASLTVGDVVFNALQTDLGEPDSTGYNFKHQLATTDLPNGGVLYRVQYKLTTTTSKPIYLEWQLTARDQGFD